MRKYLYLLLCVLVSVAAILSACSNKDSVVNNDIEVTETKETEVKETSTLVPTATPTIEPTPTLEPTPTSTFYYEARNFSDEVAWVKYDSSQPWVCIDLEGNELFRLAEDHYPETDFINGKAYIQDYNEGGDDEDYILLPICIDKNNSVLNEGMIALVADQAHNYEVTDFDYDLGVAYIYEEIDTFEKFEQNSGAIDFDGNFVIPMYQRGMPYECNIEYLGENICYYEEYMRDTDKLYSNQNEQVFILPSRSYEVLTNIEEGYGYVFFMGEYDYGKEGLYKMDKNLNVSSVFDDNDTFAYGKYYFICSDQNMIFRFVTESNDKTGGCYDYNDNLIFEVDYDVYDNSTVHNSLDFENGYSHKVVLENEGGTEYFAYIDIEGQYTFEPKEGKGENYCEYVSCNLILVSEGGSYYYVDVNDNVVIDSFSAYSCNPFFYDRALVEGYEGYYYIDKNGDKLFD